jgi:hypothetical protein
VAPIAAAVTTAPSARPEAVAPRIVVPAPNSVVRQGQLRAQAVPSANPASREAEIEYAWLAPLPAVAGEPAPSSRPAPAQWTVPIDQLAQGVAVPPGAGPRSSGRWQMRARLAGGASGWSEPVIFDYVAVNEQKGNAWGRKANELERQGLNPQPLPPKNSAAPASAFQR